MMRPGVAAAEVSVGAGCRGWASRPRPRVRPRRVRVGGASNPHAAAAATASGVRSTEQGHRHGVRLRLGPGGADREGHLRLPLHDLPRYRRISRRIRALLPQGLHFCDGRLHRVLLARRRQDTYLIGTVMFVFGTGLYELFISNIDIAKQSSYGSSLFGLFRLPKRPKWLEIQSVNDLKTKLGHFIVMVLLVVGISEKSKRVNIASCTGLFCFAASIFLSSGCLYLLSRLGSTKGGNHA